LEQTGKLSIDEKTKVFIDQIRDNDPKLGERLHKVILDLANKKKLLTEPAQELFDLVSFVVKILNVPILVPHKTQRDSKHTRRIEETYTTPAGEMGTIIQG
jgi:hypothetical protein